jgi:hypothetical protein
MGKSWFFGIKGVDTKAGRDPSLVINPLAIHLDTGSAPQARLGRSG